MKKINRVNWIFRYYQDISEGSVTVGRWIRILYEYLVHGLESKLFFFDQKKANTAIEWIETHSFHVEGPLAPGAISLEPWQKAFLSAIYGIVDESGYRHFREVVLVIARKNGKSILGSAMAGYTLRQDGGFGGRVYNVAPKLDQASIIYDNTWAMICIDPDQREKLEELQAGREQGHRRVEADPTIVQKRVSDLYVPGSNSTMKKLAFSAKKSDGFNPSLVICDEVAAWEGDKGLKQYEVLRSAMGGRPEPLIISCTTSGYINDSIYDELVKRSTRFLMGESKEKRLLPFLYMIDDVENWNDINEIRKANPNFGVSVMADSIIEDIAVAEGSLSKKAEFLTKVCCIKQNSSLAWLSAEDVNKMCGVPLNIEDFAHSYCVAGIDLSQTTDLTAACVVIEKDGELYVFAKFFLPAEKIDEATQRDGLPYNVYIQRGLLQPSGDNFVDYRDCFAWLTGLVEQYEILPLMTGYDRYSAQYLINDLEAYGFRTDSVFQGENLYGVLREMEGLIKDGRVYIGDNDLLKVHFLNSAIKMSTERGRGKLVKLAPNDHIDGVAALADAFTVRQKHSGEIGEQLRN